MARQNKMKKKIKDKWNQLNGKKEEEGINWMVKKKKKKKKKKKLNEW